MEYTKQQYLEAMKHCIKGGSCSDCHLGNATSCRNAIIGFTLNYIEQSEKAKAAIANNRKSIDKAVDDALEKNDRSVCIFISKDGNTSINIDPYKPEEKPKWIADKDITGRVCGYVCSECGCYNSITTAFCPNCGEKLSV